MRQLALGLPLLAGLAAAAAADVRDVDPLCCGCSLDATQRLLMIPDRDGADPAPAGSFTVTIRTNDCHPIAHAVVKVLVRGISENRTKLCGGAVTMGITDDDGIAALNIPGGGCIKARTPSRSARTGCRSASSTP